MDVIDYPAAHRDALERLDGFLRELDQHQRETLVPACPQWNVLDIARHLTGLAVDCSGDTLPAPADWEEETMDRRHVDARRGMTLEEVLEEWKEAGPGLEHTLGRIDPRMAGAIAGEYACHEHDVRAALHRPGARTTLCTAAAMDAYVNALLRRVEAGGLPALEVRAGDQRWGTEGGGAATQVAGDPFEIFRAVTGRRTADQIRAFEWRGDADPYLPVFSAFGVPDSPLAE
jgi:uncharacterized protein (TIGR03083 family)